MTITPYEVVEPRPGASDLKAACHAEDIWGRVALWGGLI